MQLWYKILVGFAASLRSSARLSVFVVGSWLVVAAAIRSVLSPFPQRWRREGPHVSRWARLGTRCLGIRVEVVGELPAPGSLVAVNHQGYADIVTVGGLFPCVFAARHDMRRWPVFGALAASGATIFINRDLKRVGYRGVGQVAAALEDGATVVVFPEGTSTDGLGLLPFRTGVFQAAVDTGTPVVPAAIRYLSLDGQPIDDRLRPLVGWYDGSSFLGHLMRLAGHRRIQARVTFAPPLTPPHADRRTLAAAAEVGVRNLLGLAVDSLPVVRGRYSRMAAPPGGRQ